MAQSIDPTLDVHLVMDNYGTHKHPDVKKWLAERPRYQVHFTPTSASWLNQIERWFAEITRKQIRRGTFRSVPDLIKTIKDYIQHYNKNPQPFRWVANASQIIRKVGKNRVQIRETSLLAFISVHRPGKNHQYFLFDAFKREYFPCLLSKIVCIMHSSA